MSGTISDVDLCADCVEHAGLCARHATHICPQLARPAWLRLIGTTVIEQTARQLTKPEQAAVERVKRRNARKLDKAQRSTTPRRGYLALARQIGVAA